MKNGSTVMVKISGMSLSFLGMVVFVLSVVLWSAEGNTTHSMPFWPIPLGVGLVVIGLICVKTGD